MHPFTSLTTVVLMLLLSCTSMVHAQDRRQQKRWNDRAAHTTIIRDNWGIPHVYGKTDADAVFGLMYAQCEDDFPRVELNYIEKLGRLAELNGVKDLWNDLYLRMIIDSTDAKADYEKSPAWLQELLQAWSDGIEYYLYTHPNVKPQLLQRFPPWFPLLWTDGSIGAINTGDVTAEDVRNFYVSGAGKTESDPSWELGKISNFGSGIPHFAGQVSEVGSRISNPALRGTGFGSEMPESSQLSASASDIEQTDIYNFRNPTSEILLQLKELSGSNGFAIAPSKSASGKAMLYINPHVTFYFRPEVQMSSEQGLQAYGAVTWGQFFIYQGFNAHGGWMHTSSNADVVDEYLEKVVDEGGKKYYIYGNERKPLKQRNITIRFRSGDSLLARTFTAYATDHGPVMASRKEGWVSVRHYNRALNSLIQSWQRTKTKSFSDYQKAMDLRGNTSNNTVYADKEGNIAYWHGNYMPKRDTRYDWSKPVDGSVLSTDYQGLHEVRETVHIYNPASGWIQNCNSNPFTAAGKASPSREKYPSYMAPDGENFRGVNAVRVLDKPGKLSMDDLIKAGYDTYLPAFEILVPALISAFEKNVPEGNLLYQEIHGAIQTLKRWDYRASASSVATTLAVEWGQKLNPVITKVYISPGEADQVLATKQFAERAGYDDLLLAFRGVVIDLKERFGTWEVPWGEINRFQRLTGKLRETYDDAKSSLPVPFAASTWGCLPAYASRRMEGTKKRYGFGGNSFICVVEFGDRVRAKSLLAGGVNNNPASPHFTDQAEMYTRGQFKEVLFYRDDVEKHAEKTYHPGEK